MQKCGGWRYVIDMLWRMFTLLLSVLLIISSLSFLTYYLLGLTQQQKTKVVTGYIWRYAKTQNASLFFRGIRTWSSDGPEERHLQILNSWGPLLLGPVWPTKTIFLEGHPEYRDVSSTVVREICAEIKSRRKKGESVTIDAVELSKLIPDHVLEKIVIVYQ